MGDEDARALIARRVGVPEACRTVVFVVGRSSVRAPAVIKGTFLSVHKSRQASRARVRANVMTTVVLSYTTIFYLLHTGLFVAAHVVVVVSKQ